MSRVKYLNGQNSKGKNVIKMGKGKGRGLVGASKQMEIKEKFTKLKK